MLVIKVELWPRGSEENATELARAYISNDVKTTMETGGHCGSYDAKFMQSVQFNPKKVWRTGRAENVNRRHRGVWDIIYLCLKSAGLDKRNK